MADKSLPNLSPFPKQVIDLTGQRFGRLTVLAYAGLTKDRQALWLCACECGAEKTIVGKSLRRGVTVSCGCYHLERIKQCNVTNGESCGNKRTAEYQTYKSAKQRCSNPNKRNFADYGGRGIEFRFGSFEEFLAELGRKPSRQYSLERINNDGHYEPGNVRWATRTEQNNNRRPRRKGYKRRKITCGGL